MQAGLKYNKTPDIYTRQNIRYNESEETSSVSDATSQSLTPYVSSQFYLEGLPHRAYVYGGLSFSYNHNKGSEDYQLMESEGQSIINGTRENAYLPSLWLACL